MMAKIEKMFNDSNKAFEKKTSKEEIVKIMKEYLPYFEGIEKGRLFDSIM